MPFIRLSDDYNDHPKFDNLSDGAFRLWHQAMGFCRKYQTDGLIPTATIRKFKSYSPKRMRELMTPWREGEQPLWHGVEGFGVRVHDYLDWNLSKEEENDQKMLNRHRGAFMRDRGLRQRLRDRDKDMCRYCGVTVNWADRKGATGATYDHVNPRGPADDGNLVIACRSCNSRKKGKTPDEAGMPLLVPPPERRSADLVGPRVDPEISRSDLDPHLGRITDSTGQDRSGSSGKLFVGKNGGDRPPRGMTYLEPPPDDALERRAGALLDRYAALFYQHQRGAKYHRRDHLDFPKACDLVRTWTDDTRLEKLAVLVLTTDDSWIAGTDRGFAVFAAKATWADARLATWEAEHGLQARQG